MSQKKRKVDHNCHYVSPLGVIDGFYDNSRFIPKSIDFEQPKDGIGASAQEQAVLLQFSREFELASSFFHTCELTFSFFLS